MKSEEIGIIIILSIFFIGFLCGIMFEMESEDSTTQYDNISIPDQGMVRKFCQDKGYKYGWLSSESCGLNEVQCFREGLDGAKYFDCVMWEVDKE